MHASLALAPWTHGALLHSAPFALLQAAQSVPRVAREATWDRGLDPWMYTVSALGLPLLAVLSALLLLRALARWNRYRAVGVLGPADVAVLKKEVADAECKSMGEIVPVVLERSDPHPAAESRAAVIALLIGTALLEPWLPWHAPHWLIAAQIAMAAVGFLAARVLPDFKRLFVFEGHATHVAEEQAFQEFYRLGLHKTQGATGVLLFVSLLEHRVIVLGDAGIDAKVGAEHWQRTKDAILGGIERGSLRDGLIDGVRACGDVLGQHFPCAPGDKNEVEDRVIVRAD